MQNAGLAQAANALRAHSRGGDTMLAHVTPQEVQFLDYMQGGPRINPATGLPEYGLFGKILKGLVRAAAGIVGFTLGGPAGAAAGAGLATKLTGGSWKDALKTGALSGLGSFAAQGLGGGGWNLTGGTMAGGAALPSASALAGANTANLAAASGIPGAVGAAAPAGATFAQSLGQAAMSAPGLAAVIPAGFSKDMPMDGGGMKPPEDTFRIRPYGLKITQNPYEGDLTQYGREPGKGGFRFTDYAWSPPLEEEDQTVGYRHGGRVRAVQRLAIGGPVGSNIGAPPGMQFPRPMGGMPAIGPGTPPGMQIAQPPGMYPTMPTMANVLAGAQPQPRYLAAGGQVGGLSPELAAAALRGYQMAAKGGKAGHAVRGPGDGKSDDIPARLSAGERIITAQDISLAGNGDNDAGQDFYESIAQEVRRRAGQKNVKKPTPQHKATVSGLVAAASRKAA